MAELNINGAAPTGIYVGSTPASAVYYGNVKVWESTPALAPRSMRFDFKYDHFNPITDLTDLSADGLIWTHVAGDVYDFHYDNADWGERTYLGVLGGLFNLYSYRQGSSIVSPMTQHQFDVLDMDLTGVTTVSRLFNSAWQALNIFSIRNASSVTNFSYFIGHNNRTILIPSLPLFDTSSATNVEYMCKNTKKVESGALALYTQMTNQTTPPSSHMDCFTNCGALTVTGAAELAQIPTSWGGTMAV